MRSHLILSLFSALLATGCAAAPQQNAAKEPFSLAGERVALEVTLRGVVSPAARSGELLWGSVQLPGGTRIWNDREEVRSAQLTAWLTAALTRLGAEVISENSLAAGDNSRRNNQNEPEVGRALFNATYSVGERERWQEGRDRKGRRASLLEVERCAVVEGEGRWLVTGETIRFPVRIRRCDRSIGELRSDAYFGLNSWSQLLETTLQRAVDDWLFQLHRTTKERRAPAGGRE